MKYGLLKEGAEGLNVRKTTGGKIVGVLRQGVKFYLTGQTAKHHIDWSEGHFHKESGEKVAGWAASSWLEVHEDNSDQPGPMYPPVPVEVPSFAWPFRTWQEAIWQLGLLGAGIYALWWLLVLVLAYFQ